MFKHIFPTSSKIPSSTFIKCQSAVRHSEATRLRSVIFAALLAYFFRAFDPLMRANLIGQIIDLGRNLKETLLKALAITQI